MKLKIWIIFLVTYLFVIILYKDALNGNFFQDDWFSLIISRVNNFQEFISLFIPRTDVIYFRPLGMQLPFYLIQSIFGVSYQKFQFFIFSFHFLNIFLVFYLIKLLCKNYITAVLSAILYGTSLIHYILFYWPATIAFVLAPTFFLISFISFVLSNNANRKYNFIFITTFISGFLINEILVSLPLILLGYSWLYDRRKVKSAVFYGSIALVFILSRFIFFTPPVHGLYQIKFSLSFLNNLEGYLLWSMNWPEEMKAQLINFYTVNPIFIKDFYIYFLAFCISLGINLTFFYLLPFISIILLKLKISLKNIKLGAYWFLTGLLPVIFFDKHSFSYYLPIAYIGFLLFSLSFFGFFLQALKDYRRVKLFFIALVLLNSLATVTFGVNFNSKVHWAPRRALISKDLISKVQKEYNYEKEIYIKPGSENILSLNNQDAFHLLYGNDVKTIYTNNAGGKSDQ